MPPQDVEILTMRIRDIISSELRTVKDDLAQMKERVGRLEERLGLSVEHIASAIDASASGRLQTQGSLSDLKAQVSVLTERVEQVSHRLDARLDSHTQDIDALNAEHRADIAAIHQICVTKGCATASGAIVNVQPSSGGSKSGMWATILWWIAGIFGMPRPPH